MADKRIKDLTNTAAESDLVSGNYFALDGSAGTKKGSADLFAIRSTTLCNSFFGNGSTYSETKITNVNAGETYVLTFANPSWPRDNTGSGPNYIFAIRYTDSSDITHDIIQIIRGNSVPKQIQFTIPTGAKNIIVGGRANAGEIVSFNIDLARSSVTCGFNQINDVRHYTISYDSSTLKINIPTSSASQNVVFVNVYGTNKLFTAQYFIDNLSATLSGTLLSFAFANNYHIVYDFSDDSLKKVSSSNLKDFQFVLLSKQANTLNGPLVNFALANFGRNSFWKKGFQFYPNAGAYPKTIYIEENANGSLFIKLQTTFYLRVISSKTYTQASLLTELSATGVTSTQGVSDCLEMQSSTNLVFDPVELVFKVVSRDVADEYINLIGCVSGTIAYASDLILSLRRESNGSVDFATSANFVSALEDVADNYAGSEKQDLFLYFTDPHSFKEASFDRTTYLNKFNIQIGNIAKWVSELSLDFVLSGGDWVQSSQLKADVIKYLSVANGKMRSMFSKELFSLVGNHEYNTYGTGLISGEEIAQFFLAGISSKAYYTKKTKNALAVLLDAGDDAWYYTGVLQPYQITQIEWFIQTLLGSEDDKIFVCTHKLATLKPQSVIDDGVIYYADMDLFIQTMFDVITAFNARTSSYSFNGNTYDFSAKSGYVEFVVSGHTHLDFIGNVNGVPILGTTNLKDDGTDFDIVSADYTNNLLKTTRVGIGSNRQLTMYSGTL